MNSNADLNVAIVLQNAGTSVATKLETTLGTPASAVNVSPLRLTSDALNLAGAAVSIFGGMEGAGVFISPIAGIAGVLANGIGIYLDAQKTTPQPDPYVTQFSDLLEQSSTQASTAALRFNTDMQTASGTYYDSAFSDWFRLQSLAMLSVDQSFGGWYVADQGASRDDYLHALTASQRAAIWQQMLPQYFELAGVENLASG